MAAGVRILTKKRAVSLVKADVTIEGTAIVNCLDDDDDGTPPRSIEVMAVIPQPIDDSDDSQSGGSDKGETCERVTFQKHHQKVLVEAIQSHRVATVAAQLRHTRSSAYIEFS